MLLSLQQQQDSIRPANAASQSLLLTPKHVGEAMSAGDPYYRPNCKAHNPFATLKRFKVHPQFLFCIICTTAMNVIGFFPLVSKSIEWTKNTGYSPWWIVF